jgi:flagellar assembly protein FliH
MATHSTKFTFDTVFDSSEDIVSDASRGRRRRSLSESEIEALCLAAKEDGKRAGEVLAMEAVAAGAREAGRAIEVAIERLALERRALLEGGAKLAFAVARKLAQAALETFPQAEVEAALREAMHQALGEPRITVRAAPSVADALGPRVSEIAHEEAFDGRIQVTGDPAIRRADCRIEWRGGGAERAEAAIEEAVRSLIARHFGDGANGAEGVGHGR